MDMKNKKTYTSKKEYRKPALRITRIDCQISLCLQSLTNPGDQPIEEETFNKMHGYPYWNAI